MTPTRKKPYFYPRPPRGGRPTDLQTKERVTNFYPRPPRGGRPAPSATTLKFQNFYPRPPRGGRRVHFDVRDGKKYNFYPRPPRGGRRYEYYHIVNTQIFLSTPSARRATSSSSSFATVFAISIHALREEGDLGKPIIITSGYNFYPRPPRGGRPVTDSFVIS